MALANCCSKVWMAWQVCNEADEFIESHSLDKSACEVYKRAVRGLASGYNSVQNLDRWWMPTGSLQVQVDLATSPSTRLGRQGNKPHHYDKF
eukprot:2273910-Amphidinium_carterae.1